MSNTPKQIWAKPTEFSLKNAKATGGVWHTRPTITPSHTRYTRDDIVDELAEALGNLIELSDDHSPFGGEIYQDRVSRAWENATATLAKYKKQM